MIVVYVPELEALLNEGRRRPRLLELFLARAESRPLDRSAPVAELLTGQSLPAAALSRLIDAPAADPGAIWMRADPMRLVPDLNAVWVQAGVQLAPDHPALPELEELFAEVGMAFELPDPERGYLRLSELPDCKFQPPQALIGQSLDHALPEGPDARLWRRLLNDAQIILHQYRDQSEVGGLWFWGAGTLPPRSRIESRVSHVSSPDPDVLSLADWLQLSHEPVDAPARVADASLVSWTPDHAASAEENLTALAAWIKPLWRRLRSARSDALELAGPERVWRLTPGRAWRFWQRSLSGSA